MRRFALLAALLLGLPAAAAAQATVGDGAEQPAMPDPAPVEAEATETEPADAEPTDAPTSDAPTADSTTSDATTTAPPGVAATEPAEDGEAPPREVEERFFVHTEDAIPRDREGTPIWESWWFWTGIAAIVLGVTAAVVVDVTTDDPRPSPRDPEPMAMGLRLRF